MKYQGNYLIFDNCYTDKIHKLPINTIRSIHNMDIELLSRIQFAFTVSFHIIFPSFSIGLITFLIIIEGLYLKTNNLVYYQIARFWIKIFALTFGMGIVAGVVMEFQLGTNWGGFAKHVGSILGPLFIYEVLTAFFVEAGFIGIVVFGWNHVGKRLHYVATIMVGIGTTISAYWIMTANTWMQHPVGYQIINDKFVATSWSTVIFNSHVFTRFSHMILASYIVAALVITSVSCYYLYNNKFIDFATRSLKISFSILAISIPAQIFVGDLSGVHVHEYQPLKTAAIEGVWHTQQGAPLLLFAIPSNIEQRNYFEIGIPKLASLLNTHEINGSITGLDTVAPQDQPDVWIVFFSFRVMVGVGLFLLLYIVISSILLYRRKFFTNRKILKISQYIFPLGFIAVLTGWFTAEVGRQPWVVYDLIRTSDAVSNISIHNVLICLLLIIIVYGVIFGYFYCHYIIKTIHNGPEELMNLKREKL